MGLRRTGRQPELAVVNPVAILGPVLGPDYSPSIMIVQRMMDGAIPGCPQRWFGIVDVRDVADLHVRAMTHPAARGERFLCTAGDFMSMRDREGAQGAHGRRRRQSADAAAAQLARAPRGAARPGAETTHPELGKRKNGTNAKARGLLGWKPRSSEDAIVASAESLIRLGLSTPLLRRLRDERLLPALSPAGLRLRVRGHRRAAMRPAASW